MNRERALKVADAVLYEGYMLYPYRPSAIKNRQRWTFGILYPPGYEEVSRGTERSQMHSEVLLNITGEADDPAVRIELRFLHLAPRQVFKAVNGKLEPVPSLLLDGRLLETWDEAVERSLEIELKPGGSVEPAVFSFPGMTEFEPLRDCTGAVIGQTSKTQCQIEGSVSAHLRRIADNLLKLSINVNNTTETSADPADRNTALIRSLLSAHLILTASSGQFVSLLEPALEFEDAIRACNNVGNFPVLVGSEGERDMMLCSPIVLYDYPQVAPESAGDFFDATEMDEMVTLRVLTLTDEEKNEMRLADRHAFDLLERTQATAREQLTRTHGTIRGMRPIPEEQ